MTAPTDVAKLAKVTADVGLVLAGGRAARCSEDVVQAALAADEVLAAVVALDVRPDLQPVRERLLALARNTSASLWLVAVRLVGVRA